MDFFELGANDHANLWQNLSLVQGDDWIFEVDLSKSAADYTLTYVWALAGQPAFSMVSTADGESFSFNVPAASTAVLLPGSYRVQAVLTELATGTKQTLGIREGKVSPNLAEAVDPRSPNRIALDAVEGALASAAPGAHLVEYIVGGKTFKKRIADLLQMRAYYLQRCRVEDGKAMPHIYFGL
jgi:hypothetical protein